MSSQRTYRDPSSQAVAFLASEDFLPASKNAQNGRKVDPTGQFGDDELRPLNFSQSPPDKEVACELTRQEQPLLPPNSPDFPTSRGAAPTGKAGDGMIDRIAQGRAAKRECRPVRSATPNRLISRRTGATDSAIRSDAARSYGAESVPNGCRASDSKTDSESRFKRRSRGSTRVHTDRKGSRSVSIGVHPRPAAAGVYWTGWKPVLRHWLEACPTPPFEAAPAARGGA